jgi:hypothetical protein
MLQAPDSSHSARVAHFISKLAKERLLRPLCRILIQIFDTRPTRTLVKAIAGREII